MSNSPFSFITAPSLENGPKVPARFALTVFSIVSRSFASLLMSDFFFRYWMSSLSSGHVPSQRSRTSFAPPSWLGSTRSTGGFAGAPGTAPYSLHAPSGVRSTQTVSANGCILYAGSAPRSASVRMSLIVPAAVEDAARRLVEPVSSQHASGMASSAISRRPTTRDGGGARAAARSALAR